MTYEDFVTTNFFHLVDKLGAAHESEKRQLC